MTEGMVYRIIVQSIPYKAFHQDLFDTQDTTYPILYLHKLPSIYGRWHIPKEVCLHYSYICDLSIYHLFLQRFALLFLLIIVCYPHNLDTSSFGVWCYFDSMWRFGPWCWHFHGQRHCWWRGPREMAPCSGIGTGPLLQCSCTMGLLAHWSDVVLVASSACGPLLEIRQGRPQHINRAVCNSNEKDADVFEDSCSVHGQESGTHERTEKGTCHWESSPGWHIVIRSALTCQQGHSCVAAPLIDYWYWFCMQISKLLRRGVVRGRLTLWPLSF